MTAYILFSADVRKITMDENPGQKFGEISRIVAERWRAMSDSDKQVYAERAKKLNEEKEREEREGKRMENERMRLAPVPATPAPAPSPVCLLNILLLGQTFTVNYLSPLRAQPPSEPGRTAAAAEVACQLEARARPRLAWPRLASRCGRSLCSTRCRPGPRDSSTARPTSSISRSVDTSQYICA